MRNGHGYHKIEKKGEVLKGTVEVLKIKKVRLSVGKQERSKFASFLRGVARWDEIEWPSNRVMESRSVEGVTIGYVPDEWDEEYDRGKRKKVRSSKGSFGEPNPFQEIATKKAHFKKAKMDRSSSRNQPLRM